MRIPPIGKNTTKARDARIACAVRIFVPELKKANGLKLEFPPALGE